MIDLSVYPDCRGSDENEMLAELQRGRKEIKAKKKIEKGTDEQVK